MRFSLYIIFLFVTSVSFAQENLLINSIKIEGEGKVHKSLIKENMSLEPTSWFKQKILKKDLVPFSEKAYNDDISRVIKEYQKNGYLDVTFEPLRIEITKKQQVNLTITVHEGEPVQVADVIYRVDSTQTLNVLPRKGERNILLQSRLTEAKTFTDEDFYKDQLLIAEEFSNIGYPFANVTHELEVDTVAKKVEIDWYIQKNQLAHFGPTTITGNQRVTEKSIRRQLAFEEGDVWSKKRIDQTQKQIYNQGMYSVASVRTQAGEQDTSVLPVNILIKEAPRWTTRFGVGYGREDKFRTFAELQYLGFITNTGRINLYGKHSGLEPYHFYLKFSQPSVFFPINTLTLYPYIQSQNEPGYNLEKMGFNISMLQNFSKQLNTSVGFEFEDVQLDILNVAGVPTDNPEDSYYKKSGIVLGGIYTTADPLLDPVQGQVVSLNIKTNGLLKTSNLPFLRLLGEYKSYIGLKNGVILALKVKAGSIYRTDDQLFIPADERFYAGGSYSVRGWQRSELGPKNEDGVPVGGKSLLEGSIEFRLNIGKMIIFNLFTDAGNVWEEAFTYKINELRYAAGAGVKVKTPIGPAGIDIARPVFGEEKKWQFHISIGHSF